MASTDNAWSRWVVLLKIILPLIALALLSSIFLLSRTIDPTATIPFTEVDVEDRAREPRLTTPKFSGVTSDGGRVTVDATDMRPDLGRPGSGSATDLRARMVSQTGETTDVAADRGKVDTQAGTYEMTGAVKAVLSTGYTIAAPKMVGLLNATQLDATGPVTATSPLGRITADAMQLRSDPAAPGNYLVVFKGRVRLVYDPQE
jgi:lipopolysaccharide export system protein LptC